MTDSHDIVVYCAHGGGHHEVGRLVTFRHSPDMPWELGLVGAPDGDFTGLTAELVDDRALPTFAAPDVATEMRRAGRGRERYCFRCECGDTLPAREERLAACAEKLAGHGASDVSMLALRRMLALI